MQMAEESNQELERFRQRWREEVTARTKGQKAKDSTASNGVVPQEPGLRAGETSRAAPPSKATTALRAEEDLQEREVFNIEGGYHDLENEDNVQRLEEDASGIHRKDRTLHEPQSALEHYEKGVEREAQGKLGDSLSHYRKAYRLDHQVHQTYKNKHFPPSTISKPPSHQPTNASPTVPNPAHHSLHGSPSAKSSISELIASFATLAIQGTPPPTEASPAPPSPISTLPSEVLVEILLRTAILDVASFARLSLVCKRLAYLVATEDPIWRRICHGHEFGFAAMHYAFVCTITGHPIESHPLSPPSAHPLLSLPLTPTHPTYRTMHHTRPRLRFPGAYISTVNYARPGASSPSQISWNTPVHIVTYYRYLRFYRDGTCISLLTTAEPIDVIPYLHRDNLGTQATTLPVGVMKNALRGRWKLSGPAAALNRGSGAVGEEDDVVVRKQDLEGPEGNLTIETEGVDSKYEYLMEMTLRSGSQRVGATRNNKLVWRGFWSWNRLTDDWAEFGLRNDRAFFWSRVRSWS